MNTELDLIITLYHVLNEILQTLLLLQAGGIDKTGLQTRITNITTRMNTLETYLLYAAVRAQTEANPTRNYQLLANEISALKSDLTTKNILF